MLRILKRYPDRRLYDPALRRDVTILEVAQMVHGGEGVKVVDSRTGRDVTVAALSTIIVTRMRAQRPQKAATPRAPARRR